jgi:SHS2 domain-containing protein
MPTSNTSPKVPEPQPDPERSTPVGDVQPPASPGHRLVPHTSDLTIESWGPTRERCIAQAALGLVAACAEIDPDAPTEDVEITYPPEASDDELLVSVLEDVIYRADVDGMLPAAMELHRRDDGGISGLARMLATEGTTAVGATPKAVTRHGLLLGEEAGEWHARVTVDV